MPIHGNTVHGGQQRIELTNTYDKIVKIELNFDVPTQQVTLTSNDLRILTSRPYSIVANW